MKARFLPVAALFMLVVLAHGCKSSTFSNYGTVLGTVKDSAHNPIGGALVQVGNASTTSKGDGTFYMELYTEGNFNITASMSRYDKYSGKVSVVNDQQAVCNIQLVLAQIRTVSSTNPPNNATGVALNSGINATFSQTMDASTITPATFLVKDSGGISVAGTVSYQGTTATFKPTAEFSANSTYVATITTVAKDVNGIALSSDYTWTFTTGAAPDNTPPTISSTNVTGPANIATDVPINTAIVVTLSETMDASTITEATFLVTNAGTNASVSGSVTYNGTTATFTPTAELSPDTTYVATITTGAKDSAGNALVSDSSWTFITGLSADTTPPSISSTSLTEASDITSGVTTSIATNTAIVATLSEAMDASTITTATFIVKDLSNTPVSGNVTYSGTTAIFTPTTELDADTTYIATITRGAKDSSGNSLPADYTWTVTTGPAPDTTAPTVSAPTDGASGVAVNSAITAVFSEGMDATSITTAAITLTEGGAAVSGSVTYNGTTATFIPSEALLDNTTYTATIAAEVKDSAGNTLVSDYTWSFTTGTTDTTPPTVSAPTAGKTGVPTNAPIIVTFSEPMYAPGITSAAFVIKDAASSPVSGNVSYSNETAMFVATGDLACQASYSGMISGSVMDLAGNLLQGGDYNWSFTTGAATTAPKAPQGVVAVPGNGKNTLTWNPVNCTTSYYVYRSTSPGVTKATGTKLPNVTTSPFTDNTVTNDQVYYYVVTAVNGMGESVESLEVMATPSSGPAAPSSVNIVPGLKVNTLSWKSVTAAVSYNIYWSTTAANATKLSGTRIGNVTNPYDHTGLDKTITYYYVVTAVNSFGESKESVVVSAKPDGMLTSWIVTVNPGTSTTAKPYALALDGSALYIAGFDTSQVSAEWRLEKRYPGNGQPYSGSGYTKGFTSSGILAYNGSILDDVIYALAMDSTSLYMAGFDHNKFNQYAVSADSEWAVDKRSSSTGTAVTAFASSGYIRENPGVEKDVIYGLAVDAASSALYLVGVDSALGAADTQWRIEKRGAANGLLDPAFGTGGVVLSNPGTGMDEARAVVMDPSRAYIYVVGWESGAADTRWRIEKRLTSDGSLDATFGSGGIVTFDQGAGTGKACAAVIDSSGLYVAGFDSSAGAGDTQWRIEKRLTSDGSLDATFGSGGIVVFNPSLYDDAINALAVDAGGLYIAGYDSSPGQGNTEWRVEKRDPTTGALIPAFGTNGVYSPNPGAFLDEATALAVDAQSLYVCGYDSPAIGKSEWRIEKMPNGNN